MFYIQPNKAFNWNSRGFYSLMRLKIFYCNFVSPRSPSPSPSLSFLDLVNSLKLFNSFIEAAHSFEQEDSDQIDQDEKDGDLESH